MIAESRPHSFLGSALGGGELSVPRHGLLTRDEEPPSTVPLVYEARCAPELTVMLPIHLALPE